MKAAASIECITLDQYRLGGRLGIFLTAAIVTERLVPLKQRPIFLWGISRRQPTFDAKPLNANYYKRRTGTLNPARVRTARVHVPRSRCSVTKDVGRSLASIRKSFV